MTHGETKVTIWNGEDYFDINVYWTHFSCPGGLYQEAEDETRVTSWYPEYDWLDEDQVQIALDKTL